MHAAASAPRRLTRRQLELELSALADPERAKAHAWFFKTGKGQYGEGPVSWYPCSAAAQARPALSIPASRRHRAPAGEHRFTALEILVDQYEAGSQQNRETIFRFYLAHTARINNWDLVDTSAPYIVGEHLRMRPRAVLDELAVSPSLWERRIAIVSTLMLIRNGEIEDTFRLAQTLLPDKHDLMHKAVGWALRETGKVSRPALLAFLKEHYGTIPRTALRYAIEHLPPDQRKRVLAGQF
ncbi:MAG: DNA alkylation repair protein [Acidobacteriaceae bacterium]|nr:DNA alkylation repair protein [Acidobacteriaceae bacterium]